MPRTLVNSILEDDEEFEDMIIDDFPELKDINSIEPLSEEDDFEFEEEDLDDLYIEEDSLDDMFPEGNDDDLLDVLEE